MKFQVRRTVDVYNAKWYLEAKNIAVSAGIQESVPRTAGRQTMRTYVEHTNPEDYYKKAILIPFLDYVLSEMDDRYLKYII